MLKFYIALSSLTMALALKCSTFAELSNTFQLNSIFVHEPETKMDTVELAQHLNYLAESHYVTTKDGYILRVDRIRKTKNTKGAILLVHAIFCTSSDFAINLANQSLAYLFANYGMDVWMINLRGNTYSRRNIKLSPDADKFWKFSFDEHASDDVPSVLDYIFDKQGVTKIHLLGHSMGATIGFAMLSDIDRFNDKIIRFTALAPLVETGHLPILFKFAASFTGIFKNLLEPLTGPEFLPNNKFMKLLAATICKTPMCYVYGGFFFTSDPRQTNYSRSEILFSHYPGGTSLQNIAHFGQLMHKNIFSHYDYGEEGNLRKYGQITPPIYNITNIKVPVAILYGGHDPVVNDIDLNILKGKLTNCIEVTRVGDCQFSHMDFVRGIYAYRDLKTALIEKIANSTN